jgi:hypothetical protein
MRILLYVAIFLFGKRLRDGRNFAHSADAEMNSYLSLHGDAAVRRDK